MAIFRATRRLLALALFLAGACGAALHATVRDGEMWSAVLFYALPLPVAGGLLLGSAILTRRGLWRRVLVLAGAASLGWWFYQSYGWAYPSEARWKVMTWNLGRPQHPSAPLIALVRAERPDIVVLVESGHIPAGVVPFYEKSLPGYRLAVESKGLACLVRGAIRDSAVRGLANGSDVAWFRVEVAGETLEIFAADLGAHPFLPRRAQAEMLAQLARGRPRTIVLGDFNTPLESLQLSPMREAFTEARTGPHRGFRETWFFNLPLLSLDQIWCSRDLKPVFSTRRLGVASDHSPVIATFDPAPAAER